MTTTGPAAVFVAFACYCGSCSGSCIFAYADRTGNGSQFAGNTKTDYADAQGTITRKINYIGGFF